jgi:hypothetical protein
MREEKTEVGMSGVRRAMYPVVRRMERRHKGREGRRASVWDKVVRRKKRRGRGEVMAESGQSRCSERQGDRRVAPRAASSTAYVLSPGGAKAKSKSHVASAVWSNISNARRMRVL